MVKLAVRGMPGSGKPDELLREAGHRRRGDRGGGAAPRGRGRQVVQQSRRRARAGARAARGRPRCGPGAARSARRPGRARACGRAARARRRRRRGRRPRRRRSGRPGGRARRRAPAATPAPAPSSRRRRRPRRTLGQVVGELGEAQRDALERGVEEVERRGVVGETGDRAARVGVPAGAALAARQGQHDEAVLAGLAQAERLVRLAGRCAGSGAGGGRGCRRPRARRRGRTARRRRGAGRARGGDRRAGRRRRAARRRCRPTGRRAPASSLPCRGWRTRRRRRPGTTPGRRRRRGSSESGGRRAGSSSSAARSSSSQRGSSVRSRPVPEAMERLMAPTGAPVRRASRYSEKETRRPARRRTSGCVRRSQASFAGQ